MNVNATQNTFELDTGAQCYVIPFSLDNEISNKPVITKNTTEPKANGGDKVDTAAKCTMTLTPKKKL